VTEARISTLPVNWHELPWLASGPEVFSGNLRRTCSASASDAADFDREHL
jgi:hypothetical protein